jgi:hypothetical protein
LQPFHRVPTVITEMLCLSCPHQWLSKQTECARAPAGARTRPRLTFGFTSPHFRVPEFNSPCVGGRKSAPSDSLLHRHVWHAWHSAVKSRLVYIGIRQSMFRGGAVTPPMRLCLEKLGTQDHTIQRENVYPACQQHALGPLF